MLRNLTPLLLAILICACANPMTILDDGDYRRAYEVSSRQIDRRLAKNKPAKNEQRIALHGSYRQWQDALAREVATINATEDRARWLRLHALYTEMLTLRRDIVAYESVVPDLVFNYDILSLERLTERARTEAADYCYAEAESRFAAARAGAKPTAREAHHWLSRSLDYAPERQAYQPLVAEMYDLGTMRLQVSPLRGGYFWDESEMAEYFNRRQKTHWRSDWLEVFHGPTDQRIDYFVELQTLGAEVSPNLEDRDRDCFKKEVQDGCKIVEEEISKGDTTIIVKKKVLIMITVRGCITEVRQYKEASGAMRVQLFPAGGAYASHSWDLYGSESWSNEFEVCEGDQRALPEHCSGSRRSYPSDWSMRCDLADELRWDLRRSLLRHFSDTQIPKPRRGLAAWLSGG